MTNFWNSFKDWLYKSFLEHPLYTVTFGVGCFLIGAFFL